MFVNDAADNRAATGTVVVSIHETTCQAMTSALAERGLTPPQLEPTAFKASQRADLADFGASDVVMSAEKASA